MPGFSLNFLDHVAIRVADLEVSAKWYEQVLGLTRYQLPEWGPFPIFLLSGKTGVALFPARMEDPTLEASSKNVKIDHFAFNLSQENFVKARQHYEELGLEYHFQDHFYFLSLYTQDPDGHTVELTTLLGKEEEFYK